MLLKKASGLAALALFAALLSAQSSPTATKVALVDHWNGRVCNCDWWKVAAFPTSGPVCPPPTLSGPGVIGYSVVLGGVWSPQIQINAAGCPGHNHGAVGLVVYKVKTSCFAGPCFLSPVGGNLTEVLCSGLTLASISGAHNGVMGMIPPQPVPTTASLLCLAWCCQATILGGGFVDLSSALYGIVGDMQ